MSKSPKANIAFIALSAASMVFALAAVFLPVYSAYLISFSILFAASALFTYTIPEGDQRVDSTQKMRMRLFQKRILRVVLPVIMTVLVIFFTIVEIFAVLAHLGAIELSSDIAYAVLDFYVPILSSAIVAYGAIAALCAFFPQRTKAKGPGGRFSKPVRIAFNSLSIASVALSHLVYFGIFSPILEPHHYPFVLTAGMIFLGLAISGYLGIRSLYELMLSIKIKPHKAAVETPQRIRRRMWTIYISSLVFVILFISVAFASQLNVFPAENTLMRNVVFILYVSAGIALITYILFYYLRQKESEKAPKKRQTPEEIAQTLVVAVSFVSAGVLGLIGVLMYLGIMEPIIISGIEAIKSIDFIVAALLLGLGPFGFYQNKKLKKIARMEEKFPDFLRDLAESNRAGMTLTNALLTTAKGKYGELTAEIRKMAAQITWGVSFVEALKLFAERIRTPLIERSVSLIREASNSGGNVVEILKAAADDAREIKQIQSERRQSMSIYVIIIYLAFFVFIAVIEILYTQFIPQIYNAVSGATGASIGGITFAPFDVEVYKTLFFHASLIQSVGGGLVGGVMEEGKAIAGLRHAFIMVIISYIAFRFVVV